MNIMKRLALGLTSMAIVGMVLVPATPAFALFNSSKSSACSGLDIDGSKTCSTASGSFSGVLKTIVNLFSLIVGVIAVIMVIVSGMKFITAAGESSKVASARATLIYALVGIFIVALAQVLVHFVLSKATQ